MFNWFIVAAPLFNLSNFTDVGAFGYAFSPYITILGDAFFSLAILITIGYVYMASDRNGFLAAIIMMLTSTIYMGLMMSEVALIIFIVSALILTVITYNKFVEGKR